MALWNGTTVQGSNGMVGFSASALGAAAMAVPPVMTGFSPPVRAQDGATVPVVAGLPAGLPADHVPVTVAAPCWSPAPPEEANAAAKRSRPTCWYFEQGMCTKGNNCPFRHDGGIEAHQNNLFAQARIEALTPVCWYYERGCCTKGSACPFKHDGVKVQMGMAAFKKLKMMEFEPQDDTIWTAVKVALEPVNHCEPDDEIRKLRTKIAQYARSAVQGIDLQQRPVSGPINEYADNLFAKLFQVFGDRPWLPQADLLLILDASVKELLPMEALVEVQADELEGVIFNAHDRALDEQRSMPIIWEMIIQLLQGPKTRSKVYKACDSGRKTTVHDSDVTSDGGAELFLSTWLLNTIQLLRDATGGYAESVLTPDNAELLFCSLVEAGALPARCMAEASVPDHGWQRFVASAVQAAYATPTPTPCGNVLYPM